MNKWQKWMRSALATLLGLVTFAGCVKPGDASSSVDDGIYDVTFDLCTELETNAVLPQTVTNGELVQEPIVIVIGANPQNEEVTGWYTDAAYTDEWDFETDTVTTDMTLYAKWVGGYEINYYLGDQATPVFTESVTMGSYVQKHEELADGYKIEGYYTSPDYTTEIDFDKPLAEPMNVYIKRSENIYFTAEAIARRFGVLAAEGVAGAMPGSISLVGEGEDSYAEINFGNTPSRSNPRAEFSGLDLDMTKSQKLRITFRNIGKSPRINLFWVAKLDDGTYVNSHGFGEDRVIKYFFQEDEIEMSPDGEWATIELDFSAESISDGVSMFANAAYLSKFRIASSYSTTDPTDYSDILQIKCIEGVADPTYVTDGVPTLEEGVLKNDSASELENAATAQKDVVGWVFPKDADSVSQVNNCETYDKTNGLICFAPFRQSGANFVLTPDEKLELGDATSTIKFKLKNLGYADSFTFTYMNTEGRSAMYTVSIDTEMEEFVEYTMIMNGADNYNGELASFTIGYTSGCLNNAIIFESITFHEFTASQIPGLNFHDKTWSERSTSDLSIAWDTVYAGSEFEVKTSGASVEKVFTQYSNLGYKNIELQYKMTTAGVSKVNVEVTIGEETKTYAFNVAASAEDQILTLPLDATGDVSKVKVIFEGVGKIKMKEIRFTTDRSTSIDFSTTADINLAQSDWLASSSYDAPTSSLKWLPGKSMTYHFGYLKDAREGITNVSLEGKTKIIIIYQNRTAVERLDVAFGLVDRTADSNWETCVKYPSQNPYGAADGVALKTNMAEDEWAAAEIDLTGARHKKAADPDGIMLENKENYAITCFELTPVIDCTNLYIRAIIIC